MGSACGACKFLRRKCTNECVFAPHFSYTNASNHFAAVHKVFGASNASKLLMNLPLERRSEAAVTISYEALARLHNPVFGCVAHIFALQNQVMSLTEEIEMMGRQLAAPIQESNNYNMTSNNNNNYLYDNKMNILQQLDIFSSYTGMNLDTSFLDQQTNMNNTQQLMPHHHLPQAFSDQMINNDTDMDTAHSTTTYLQNPWILLPNDVEFN